MFTQMKDHLAKQLAEIKANGLYKVERTIITPQSSAIRSAERSGKVLNFCANNYLGLSDNPRLISAAGQDTYCMDFLCHNSSSCPCLSVPNNPNPILF